MEERKIEGIEVVVRWDPRLAIDKIERLKPAKVVPQRTTFSTL